MKKIIMAIAMGASALGTMPAQAQRYDRTEQDQRRDARDDRRDERRDQRDEMRDRRDERQDARREARRDEWRYGRRYDWNRTDPRAGGYYADRYYRDGRYYQQRRMSYNDRVYRGNDGRYYCRRSDGTTGLIIGAGAGALLGNALSNGRSSLLGTLLGAGVGGVIGNSVDRGRMICR